ncbi:MAG: hypothetical protein OXF02_02865 [Simkaniaceae bacterium]|nr:hypothetical protein [Simkaniaceae bacterium]
MATPSESTVVSKTTPEISEAGAPAPPLEKETGVAFKTKLVSRDALDKTNSDDAEEREMQRRFCVTGVIMGLDIVVGAPIVATAISLGGALGGASGVRIAASVTGIPVIGIALGGLFYTVCSRVMCRTFREECALACGNEERCESERPKEEVKAGRDAETAIELSEYGAEPVPSPEQGRFGGLVLEHPVAQGKTRELTGESSV